VKQIRVFIINDDHRGAQIFQKSRCQLKSLGAWKGTWSKLHTVDPQILDALSLESHWGLHSMQLRCIVVTQLIFHIRTGYLPQDTAGSCGATRVLRGSRADLNTYDFCHRWWHGRWNIESGKTRLWHKRSLPWEDCENPQSRLVDASAEIRTAPLPTTNQQHYRLNHSGSWAEYLARYSLNSGADQAAVAIRQPCSSFCVEACHEGIRDRDRFPRATVVHFVSSTVLSKLSCLSIMPIIVKLFTCTCFNISVCGAAGERGWDWERTRAVLANMYD